MVTIVGTRRHITPVGGSRRSLVRQHVPVEDPSTPGVCQVCHLPILTRGGRYANNLHVTVDQLLQLLDAATSTGHDPGEWPD